MASQMKDNNKNYGNGNDDGNNDDTTHTHTHTEKGKNKIENGWRAVCREKETKAAYTCIIY